MRCVNRVAIRQKKTGQVRIGQYFVRKTLSSAAVFVFACYIYRLLGNNLARLCCIYVLDPIALCCIT